MHLLFCWSSATTASEEHIHDILGIFGRPLRPKFIINPSFFSISQSLISLRNLFEFVRITAFLIRVMHFSQIQISFLDLGLTGVFGYSESLIVFGIVDLAWFVIIVMAMAAHAETSSAEWESSEERHFL